MNVLAFLLAGSALFGQPFVSPAGGGGDIDTNIDTRDLRVCCEKILRDGQRVWFLSDRNGKMKLQVRGIYIHGNVLFFLLQGTNRSSRDYVIDGIRFQPTDRDGDPLFRPHAGQAPLEPVFIYDSTKKVPGNGRFSSVFVLPRFTLPSGGKLWIEMRETNGGRLLRIPVTNLTLARARPI